jgi:hypothetical protein
MLCETNFSQVLLRNQKWNNSTCPAYIWFQDANMMQNCFDFGNFNWPNLVGNIEICERRKEMSRLRRIKQNTRMNILRSKNECEMETYSDMFTMFKHCSATASSLTLVLMAYHNKHNKYCKWYTILDATLVYNYPLLRCSHTDGSPLETNSFLYRY